MSRRSATTTFYPSPWALIAALALLLVFPAPGAAATFTINSTASTDDALPGDGVCNDGTGVCTLRAALQEADLCAGSTTFEITASGQIVGDFDFSSLTCDTDVDLRGPGAELLTIVGSLHFSGHYIEFNNVPGVRGRATGLTVEGSMLANIGYGLTLTDVAVTGDLQVYASSPIDLLRVSIGGSFSAESAIGPPLHGPWVAATIQDSEVTGGIGMSGFASFSMATTRVGSVTLGSGNPNRPVVGPVSITTSTIGTLHLAGCNPALISANTILGDFSAGNLDCGSVDIVNNTVEGNFWGSASPSQVRVYHSTVSGNAAGRFWLSDSIVVGHVGGFGDCDAGITLIGSNLVGSLEECSLVDGTDVGETQIGVDPQLGPLADNGGPTLTRSVLADSPAIDNARSCEAADQRGVSRPQGVACDIGAFEFACGNATVDLGETCDDGNVANGDCCSASCQVEASGTICRPAASACDIAEECNGVDPVCPDDVNLPCPTETTTPLPAVTATETVEPTSTLTPTPTATTTATDTSSPTPTPTATTSPTASAAPIPTTTPSEVPTLRPACADTPQGGCKTPSVAQKSTLTIKDKALDKNDSLVWQWLKGSPTSKLEFGAPDFTTDYALCIYDTGSSPRLVLDAEIPGGTTCGTKRPKACWKPTRTGFTYKDQEGASDGVRSIVLQEGTIAGKAKIVVAARGVHLDVPSPAGLVPPLTVQLTNSDGRCWEAAYSLPTEHEASTFKGKADPTPLPRATRTPTPTASPTMTPHRTSTPARTATAHPTTQPTVSTPYCCKHCTTGKPCGDSCIARHLTCHQPPGCAC